MTFDGLAGVLMMALFFAAVWRVFRRRKHIGPAAAGTLEDMLNQDKRRAIQIIVEEKAEERRPEYPDDVVDVDKRGIRKSDAKVR
jgi:hypothetical protein